MKPNFSQLPSTRPETQLRAPRRCLIVEDEAVICMDLENIVNSFGVSVVDIAHTLANALALVRDNSYDVALLDLNIGAASILPVAEVLAGRRTPFAVVTGWDYDIPAPLKDIPRVAKPFSEANIVNILARLLPSKEET